MGRKNGNGFEYTTISKILADDINEIALKCGYRSIVYPELRNDRVVIKGKEVNQTPIIYIVGISPESEMYYPKPNTINYDGKIACLTVEDNHVIMVRRNGKPIWSGNCSPWNEATPTYFFIGEPLYEVYRPKPWQKERVWFDVKFNIECVMRKIKEGGQDEQKEK